MMYIVLTALLALNVAAEVLEAFKVVDSSLIQTMKTMDMKNSQIYASFEQAYVENPAKVEEWKGKADEVRDRTNEMISYIGRLKDDLVDDSGSTLVTGDNPVDENDYYHVTESGDTVIINKEDDLNSPSEFMITQKRAEELKAQIIDYKNSMVALVSEDDVDLKETILQELATDDPQTSLKEGEGNISWESERFENKPLVAVLTLLSKIQIDVKNAESNLINYLYAQIDAESFKFNKLGARVIPNSNLVLQGEEYVAEVFLAAEDTTQQPEIYINGQQVEVQDGKATYRVRANNIGEFSWNGYIRYRTPAGIVQQYDFEQNYQVTEPSVTMSVTRMNVFFRGLENEFDVGGGGIPKEDLSVEMTNGTATKRGDGWIIEPDELDDNGNRTTVSVYANIDGQRRLMRSQSYRVKRVPDPVAQVANQSGGDIRRDVLQIQDGILAVLEDFYYDYEYTITEFEVEITGGGGYTSTYRSTSNRFTQEQKDQFARLSTNNIVYISNIKAVGDNGEERDLDDIAFKIQ